MEDIDEGHFQRTEKPFNDPRLGLPGQVIQIAGPWIKVRYDDEKLEPRWWHESWLYKEVT